MSIAFLSIAAALTATSAPATATYAATMPVAAKQGNASKLRHRRGHRRGYHGDIWRDDRGRYRCRRDDGTVGLIVGGGVGALIGREIDGGRDRTVGTVVGAAAGALIGREIDRSDARCE